MTERLVIHHETRRTVTGTDELLFAALAHNQQPLHLDAEAAAQFEFGRILVNSIFTFGLMVGLPVGDTTLGTLLANLGMDKLVFPMPLRIGDPLHAEATIMEKRESKSRPGRGSVLTRRTWATGKTGLPPPSERVGEGGLSAWSYPVQGFGPVAAAVPRFAAKTPSPQLPRRGRESRKLLAFHKQSRCPELDGRRTCRRR